MRRPNFQDYEVVVALMKKHGFHTTASAITPQDVFNHNLRKTWEAYDRQQALANARKGTVQ